jgi:hypothetical protein
VFSLAPWSSRPRNASRRSSSRLGPMCECGRRTSNRIGLISKVHGRDEIAVHGEYVENLAIRKYIPLKALDKLVHPDAG